MLQHTILQGKVARVLQLQEEVNHKAVSMALLWLSGMVGLRPF